MTWKVSCIRERYAQTWDKKGKGGSVIALRRLMIISSLWDSKGNSAFSIFRRWMEHMPRRSDIRNKIGSGIWDDMEMDSIFWRFSTFYIQECWRRCWRPLPRTRSTKERWSVASALYLQATGRGYHTWWGVIIGKERVVYTCDNIDKQFRNGILAWLLLSDGWARR